ncbi:hypothetical protein FRX31_004317 [Thalictrum thalictroides]|uniref:Uncharacterized protein n=1 Tax=Thalictrum thalictroides TaxID=46969 RepID=A0A7J6X8Y1_THATH|nr:hypothetical protein FRX31_004317 [Thalictrum thalictroides]
MQYSSIICVVQYLKEAGGGVMACTQPRLLAVQAVPSRVAEVMGVKLGEEVPYTIFFKIFQSLVLPSSSF